MLFRLITFTGLMLVLTGCIPYSFKGEHKPLTGTSHNYSLPIETNENFSEPWWYTFERDALNQIIIRGFKNNYDVLEATANLTEARALKQNTAADLFPQIDLGGDISKQWQRSNGQQTVSDIGAELSWEVDVFGRIRSAAKADKLEALARKEDIEAVKLFLSTEIADAYFGSVAAHRRLELLKEQVRLDRDLQDLLQLRLDNGVGTNVDVLRQSARVADSQTLLPLAELDLALYENRLDVLLGMPPDGLLRVPASESLYFESALPPIGVPAALLINRPDLRAMHADLAAADADISEAIADRLPRITLTGGVEYADTASFAGPLTMIAGGFVQPLLDWGKRKAEVERNKALYQAKLAAFTQLYLEAVEDVENALIRENKQREFLKRLETQRNILQKTVEASEKRYTQGVDDYLPVIDSLQELRDVERDLITEQLELVFIRIDLYRAIGAPIYPTHGGKDD